MRKMVFSIIGIIFMLLLASPSFSQERGTVRKDAVKSAEANSDGRLALLIGDSAYIHGGSVKFR